MMGLTGRVLPAEEWAEKLVGTVLEHRQLNPACTRVVVVEDETGKVIASVAALTLVHAEGLSIDPSAGAGVARLLLDQLVHVLVSEGVPEVLSQSETVEMDRMFEAVGGSRVPGSCWVLPVGDLAKV